MCLRRLPALCFFTLPLLQDSAPLSRAVSQLTLTQSPSEIYSTPVQQTGGRRTPVAGQNGNMMRHRLPNAAGARPPTIDEAGSDDGTGRADSTGLESNTDSGFHEKPTTPRLATLTKAECGALTAELCARVVTLTHLTYDFVADVHAGDESARELLDELEVNAHFSRN